MAVRDELGLVPGAVELIVDGAALLIEPVADEALEWRAGRLVVPPSGATMDDDSVRTLRGVGRT